ncbi:carboxymuconolactone decarboxylase family protein [Luteipulveratus mongoliensis]|uniref:4-carboxymuconolactone decarboxylase n=1 Tax=Luteipulveratus mongoliensis TaxID=571913 RepID=A0A0K1JKQ7_9MICO|nr:carboxymuconolactone decarboxylase family protein [Luteipulveratus mongoliensis]AKU17304.1 4-carboxymuconolactone decarboxylase [Luteipulveratus mongoliensis]
MSARIGPGTRREMGLPAYVMTRVAGKVTHTEPPAIFTTLARTRKTYWGWLGFAATLMPFGSLHRRESELVILRTAHRKGSDYEWAHHERLGRRAGLSRNEIEALGREDAGDWSPREATLIAATDELLRDDDLSDAMWTRVREHLDERESIELLLLIGHYAMLATTLSTLRISPDSSS